MINAFIPLMPTTVFLLVGAWALSKGSPEWRAKLIAHPRFGRALRDWEDGRRVSRRGKRLAALGVAVSHVRWSSQFHGFVSLADFLDDGKAALAASAAALRSAFTPALQ